MSAYVVCCKFGSVVYYIHGFGWYTYILNCDMEFFETHLHGHKQSYTHWSTRGGKHSVEEWEECVWVCGVWVCSVWCVGVWCVNGGGNQNKEYGSLLTLPTKSTFLPLTMHIPLSCALISPSLPLPLLLFPISTPPMVNNGPAWMTLVSLVLYSSTSR